MGKGNRNRLDRAEAVTEPKKASAKVKKARKPMSKTLKVTIPAGIDNGQTISPRVRWRF